MRPWLLVLVGLLVAGAAGATGSLTEEQGSQELEKELESLNQQAQLVLQQVDKLPALAPAYGPQLDRTKERALRLATDDRFLKAGESLWQSPKRNQLLLIQLGFFVFMTLFRAWRQSRAAHWFRRVLIGFACSLLTWAGLFYVIPLLVLGEPFAVFTGTLWRVLVVGA